MEKKNKIGRPIINTDSSVCHPLIPSYAKGLCKSCYNKQYRSINGLKIDAQNLAWQKANLERFNAKKKEWDLANPEKVKETKRLYVSRNLHLYRAHCAKRRAAKLQRTPPWANLKDIKRFYMNCPEGMEVDHIIPLQGETVSGLHVLKNLQYLTPEQNRSKHNDFPLEEK